MDLNYLFHRRGVSLMLAERAACPASRDAHLELADGYAERIALALPTQPALAA